MQINVNHSYFRASGGHLDWRTEHHFCREGHLREGPRQEAWIGYAT
jgi:hypothetical protein